MTEEPLIKYLMTMEDYKNERKWNRGNRISGDRV